MKILSFFLISLVGIAFASYAQTAHQHNTATSQQQALYYTCPMHPEVHSNQPGDCPTCGMTLQPVYENSDAPSESMHNSHSNGSHSHH